MHYLKASALALGLVMGASLAYADEARFAIAAYELEGVSLLSAEQAQAVVAAFVGPDKSLDDINAAAEALRQAYEAAGYPVVKVFPPAQQAEQGRIRLKVIEGKVQQIRIKGNQAFDAENVRASLPPLQENMAPNTRRIIAAIAAANESPAKQVAVNFQAAEVLGDIDAVVNVSEDRPEKFTLSADNMGSKATGVNRYSLGYQHANLFNRDHMLTVTIGSSFDFPDKSLNVSGGYRIPFYGAGLSLDLIAAYSDSSATTNVGFGTANQFSGKGTTLGLRLNQPLASAGEYRHKFIYGLDYKDFRNECSNGSGPGRCGTITSQPLSLTYFGQMANPGYQLSGSAGIVANLPGGPSGGGQEYAANTRGDGSDWHAWRVNASLGVPLAQDYQIRIGLAGQFSPGRLIAGEQFGLGGAASVRGYMERTATGDSGYSSNLEFYTPDWGKVLGAGVNLRALLFYDLGRVYYNQPDGTSNTDQLHLASYGAGLRFNLGRDVAFKFDVGVTQDRFISAQQGTGMTRQRGDAFGHAALSLAF